MVPLTSALAVAYVLVLVRRHRAALLRAAATEVCFRWTIRDEGRDAGRLLLALAALIGAAEGMLWLTAG